MKFLFSSASSLFLPALLLAAPPQAAPSAPAPATTAHRTAERRAATYKGPKVVKDTKRLGREFIRDSKPAPRVVSPAKQ